jgi:putative spermidine/putrescine transport system permease protein
MVGNLAPDTSALRWKAAGRAVNLLLWAVVLVLCLVPFALVLVISFGHKVEGAGWEWAFTTDNYLRFFVGARWPTETTFLYVTQLYWSMRYAVVASILAVVTALPFTYLMTRQSRRAQAAWLVLMLTTARGQGLTDMVLGTVAINRPSAY